MRFSDVACKHILAAVNRQVGDGGLWFIAETAPEAYLQQELRRLHSISEFAADAQREP